jgi:hypothetical protein
VHEDVPVGRGGRRPSSLVLAGTDYGGNKLLDQIAQLEGLAQDAGDSRTSCILEQFQTGAHRDDRNAAPELLKVLQHSEATPVGDPHVQEDGTVACAGRRLRGERLHRLRATSGALDLEAFVLKKLHQYRLRPEPAWRMLRLAELDPLGATETSTRP